MMESIQKKLSRIRAPRVQITYDVEVGGAKEKKELPMVVGIVADLSGDSLVPKPKVKDRAFIEIDGENFDDVMAAIRPRVKLSVANEISGNGNMEVELEFLSNQDFDPLSIVKQVPDLKDLYEARTRLADLLIKLDGNEDLDILLQQVLGSPDTVKLLQSEVGGSEGQA
jgi:type VI secretion system protein ImpB